jgi:hypothetical protein
MGTAEAADVTAKAKFRHAFRRASFAMLDAGAGFSQGLETTKNRIQAVHGCT